MSCGGRVFTFIDEHEASIDDALFELRRTPDFWRNVPSSRHAGAGNLAYVDGHVAPLKWAWPKNIKYLQWMLNGLPVANKQDLKDLQNLQQRLPELH